MDNNVLQEMVGKTIENILFGFHKEYEKNGFNYIKFICTEGNFIYYLEADCCSESYFYNISDISIDRPIKIESVVYIENVQCGQSKKQEYDLNYFIFFNTQAGGCPDTFYINFRNSSNGYYNGRITLLTEDHPFYESNKICWKPFKEIHE